MDQFFRRLWQNDIFVAITGALLLYTLYYLRTAVMLLLVAFLLTIALRPFVKRAKRMGVPAGLAAPVTALLALGVIGGLFYLIYAGLSDQLDNLQTSLNEALQQLPIIGSVNTDLSAQSIVERIFDSTNQALTRVTSTVANVVVGFITVLVVSIYWLIDYDKIKNYILSKFSNRITAENTYKLTEQRLGGWIRGQLAISFVVGVLSYVVYLTIGLPAALALAVIAALLEIIPTLGPILAAVPAILVGLTISPQIAFITLLANIGIQQAENHLIAPKILQYTAKLHPVAIILALFIGNEIAGLLGVFLAVPVTLLGITIKLGATGTKPKKA